MSILNFFQNRKECKHNKVSPEEEISYCPDCGKLIANQWYLVRCDCCGIKQKAIIKDGEITSEDKYCHNCGGKHFKAELIPKINCIDINYAVLVKTVIEPAIDDYTQCWTNISQNTENKLLTQT